MIKITSATEFSIQQLDEIQELESVCRTFDNTISSISFAQELNFNEDMDSFFFAYEDDKLVGMISVFAPVKGKAELSAFVLPQKREQGVFKSLLKKAAAVLEKYEVHEVYFVHDEANKAGAAVLEKLETTLSHSEYLLVYDKNFNSTVQSPQVSIKETYAKDIKESVRLAIEIFGGEEKQWTALYAKSYTSPKARCFTADYGGETFGICSVNNTDKGLFLFSLGILPAFRSKGLGRSMLFAMTGMLSSESLADILLEVDSENIAAYNLYTTSGFKKKVRFDYHELSLISLKAKLGML